MAKYVEINSKIETLKIDQHKKKTLKGKQFN